MHIVTLQRQLWVSRIAPKLREVWRRFLQVLDDFAEARARKAVRQSELLRVQREIDSYHELIVDRSLLRLGEHHMKPSEVQRQSMSLHTLSLSG
jgi:hypothetical protein